MRLSELHTRSRLGELIASNPTPTEARITCEALHGPGLPGMVESQSAILGIQGYLDRDAYRRIVEAAEDFLERGISRLGILVDSGGGELAGLEDAVHALVLARQELKGNVWSFAARTAGSCAYALLACGAPGKVLADAGAMVGSVKTILRLEDTSRLYEEGLLRKAHLITSGAPLKQIGAPGIEITEEQLNFLRRQVDSSDAGFVALAAAARGVSPREMARMADKGGLYDAGIAREIGLIDGLTTESRFRLLVEGHETQENEMSTTLPGGPQIAPPPMQTAQAAPTPPAGTPSPPATQPPAPQMAAQVPPAYQPATPTWTSTAPFAPAAPAAWTGAYAPVQPEAPPAWAEQLRAAVTQTAQAVAVLATGLGAERLQSQIGALEARLRACAGTRLTPTAVEAKVQTVQALVQAGQTAAAEQLVADAENSPAIDESANLGGVVTYQAPMAEQPQTQAYDLSYFASPGPNGEAQIPGPVRERATEVLSVLGSATPGNEMAALENLYRQVGFLGAGGRS